jgi:hypothetical protein
MVKMMGSLLDAAHPDGGLNQRATMQSRLQKSWIFWVVSCRVGDDIGSWDFRS